MKSLILGFILAFCTTAYAANDSRSVRSPDGVIVVLGDSRQKVLDAFRREQPVSVNNYFLDDGRVYGRATDYVYQIDNSNYTITLLRERVYRIRWERR